MIAPPNNKIAQSNTPKTYTSLFHFTGMAKQKAHTENVTVNIIECFDSYPPTHFCTINPPRIIPKTGPVKQIRTKTTKTTFGSACKTLIE